MPSEWASPRIPSPRVGDEIVVAGEFLHTDAPNRVVCWFDPGGFDAYRTTPALPVDTAPGATPKQVAELGGAKGQVARYGSRRLKPKPAADGVVGGCSPRGGAGALVTDARDLTECVTQLVVHHDGCGRSRECFRVLHDERGLSCHFLVDVDGRVFQTLDVAERAWHATDANDVSVGVELASLGAFREPRDVETTPFDVSDTDNVKEHRDFKRGVINGQTLVQLNFTDKQYDALARLYATLVRRFPKLKLAYPISIQRLSRDTTPFRRRRRRMTGRRSRRARLSTAMFSNGARTRTSTPTSSRTRGGGTSRARSGTSTCRATSSTRARRLIGNASSPRRAPRWRRTARTLFRRETFRAFRFRGNRRDARGFGRERSAMMRFGVCLMISERGRVCVVCNMSCEERALAFAARADE